MNNYYYINIIIVYEYYDIILVKVCTRIFILNHFNLYLTEHNMGFN